MSDKYPHPGHVTECGDCFETIRQSPPFSLWSAHSAPPRITSSRPSPRRSCQRRASSALEAETAVRTFMPSSGGNFSADCPAIWGNLAIRYDLVTISPISPPPMTPLVMIFCRDGPPWPKFSLRRKPGGGRNYGPLAQPLAQLEPLTLAVGGLGRSRGARAARHPHRPLRACWDRNGVHREENVGVGRYLLARRHAAVVTAPCVPW